MKISDIKTTFLNLPHREPEFVSTGYRLGTTEILIEVETDEGIMGLGECICRPNSQVIEAAILSAKPFLLGRDPRNIERILNDLRSLGNWSFFERVGNVMMGGIETALWDILGKASGQPLYFLLGGLLRERIPIFYYLLRFPLDEMVRRARQAVSEGYQTIFFKVGGDLNGDIAAIEAVRDAVGTNANIRVDANEAWTPGTAIRFIKQVEKFDLEWVEEPVIINDLNALAHVRRSVNTPIAANQSSWTLYDAKRILQANAADVLVIDQWQMGGLLFYKKAAALAEAYGVGVNHHSWGETSVGHFAGFHVVASSPNFLYANQSYLMMREDDIIQGGPPKIEQGCVEIPHGPGIGVELDREAVGKAAERYRRDGPYAAREGRDDLPVTLIPQL